MRALEKNMSILYLLPWCQICQVSKVSIEGSDPWMEPYGIPSHTNVTVTVIKMPYESFEQEKKYCREVIHIDLLNFGASTSCRVF